MRRHAKVLFAVTALFLLCGSSQAFAAKGLVATLGGASSGSLGGLFSTPAGVAVNKTGNGGVPAGTFYVADRNNRRIQRFNAKGEFVSAWGFDVFKPAASPASSAVYEICTIAAECKAAVAGNGTTTGTGAGQFSGTTTGGLASIAVDQVTGNVFAADQTNRRISVFSPTGTFEGAFGWGALDGTAALQFCTSVSGCSAPAAAGAAAGQLGASIGGMALDASSNLYVADRTNRRVDVFKPVLSGKSKVVSGIEFVQAFGWGVDTNASEFQTCTVASTCNAGIAGTNVGQFGAESPLDIALDGSGNIFALDNANKRVEKFSSAPAPLEGAFGAAAITAAFGTGALYNLSYETVANHLYVSGSNSANANKVAVAELDETGASVATHGTELTATTANGLAVTPASLAGAIFLSSISGGHFLFVLNDPTTPTMEPVTTHTGTTATFEGVVVSNEVPVTYHFEYSTDGEIWTNYPLADASAGSAPTTIPVSQAITGLSGSQLYHVRLRAARQTPGGTVTSSEVTFTTDAAAPVITGTTATERTETSATLQAAVNPENEETSYHFEYVDQEEFEANGFLNATHTPASDASAGAGGSPVAVEEPISSLQPDTVYHFRLVAVNATGTTEGEERTVQTFPDHGVSQNCPNQTLRLAQHTTYLPDCRAMELVNQPDKGNQNVTSEIFGTGSSEFDPTISLDGDSAVWSVTGSAPGGAVSTRNYFVAIRGAAGWQSQGLAPPPAEQVGDDQAYLLEKVTPDFHHFVFGVGANGLGVRPQKVVRYDLGGSSTLLDSYAQAEPFVQAGYGEISDDGTHVLVINPETRQLVDVGSGSPELISEMPGGGPSECGLSVENGVIGESFAGSSASGDAAGGNWRPGYGMMDVENASRVYFETAANGDCGGSFGLYERNRETEETVLIDPGTGSGITTSSEFIRSTPDGRHAYFVTLSQLDTADTNSTRDVYRWDEESGESVCLTCVVPNANVFMNSHNGQVVMVSDDFSHIYFKSAEELVPGKGTGTYVLSEGTIRYVGGEAVSLGQSGAELSADGNTLLFVNNSSGASELTSEQLAGVCAVPPTKADFITGPCRELFIYDDHSGSFTCISCVPGGVTTWDEGSPYQFRGADVRLSADGSTAAFVTMEALDPMDVNNAADVYEWREGKVRLITDGVSAYPSGLAALQVRGVSEDGSAILFIAEAPGLTGFEQDGLTNLYVARVDGGFEVPPAVAHCSEESCQGPLQAAPQQPEAGSAGFSGRGNVEEAKKPRCRKGKVRRHGRCVSRHTHKRRHARASHTEQGRTK